MSQTPPSADAAARREDALKATSSAVLMGAGQVGGMLFSSILALVVPAVFGPSDYGHWVFFRSIVTMLIGTTLLGAGPMMSVHYVSRRIEHREDDAARLFKCVFLLRTVIGLVMMAAGVLMLWTARNPVFGPGALAALAASLLFRVLGGNFVLLLYGERHFARLSVALVLQQATVPAVITLAYLKGGFAWVPVGCALGDGLNMLISYRFARPHFRWPAGWPRREEWKPLLHFAGAVAYANTAVSVYGQSAPYLMGLAGFGAAEIGHVGLALRLSQVGQSLLQQFSSAIFPSLRVALVRYGLDRLISWRSFSCRLGALAALTATGAWVLLGGWIVPLIWGRAFAPAALLVAVALASLVPRWVGDQYGALLTVMERPQLASRSVTWLLLAFLTAFLWFIPRFGTLGVPLAMFASGVAYMVSGWWLTRRLLPRPLGLRRLWGPAAVVTAAWLVRGFLPSAPAFRCIFTAGWLAVLAAVSIWSRSLAWTEGLQLLEHLRLLGRRRSVHEKAAACSEEEDEPCA